METALENEGVLSLDALKAKLLATEQVTENQSAYEAVKTGSNEELYVTSEDRLKILLILKFHTIFHIS